jgi:hypothetical protein
MTMNQSVNKTQAVLDYIKTHPAAMCQEIVAALDEQGIRITFGHVATIKARAAEAAKTAAPQEKLTLEQIKMVANAIKKIRSTRSPFVPA